MWELAVDRSPSNWEAVSASLADRAGTGSWACDLAVCSDTAGATSCSTAVLEILGARSLVLGIVAILEDILRLVDTAGWVDTETFVGRLEEQPESFRDVICNREAYEMDAAQDSCLELYLSVND